MPSKKKADHTMTLSVMLSNMPPIYFVDIETVSEKNPKEFLKGMDITYERRFRDKSIRDGYISIFDHYIENAALYAEHCKIVCISMGVMYNGQFMIKTIINDDEKALLIEAEEQIAQAKTLCAHNGLEFDFPIWMRRCIINGVPIPTVLNISGKKVWDVKDQLLDTMQMWSGTAWNYRVSLSLLASVLGIPSPKQNMDGSMVGELYYSNDPDRLQKIAKYCAGDVLTEAQVYMRIKGEQLINKDQIIYK